MTTTTSRAVPAAPSAPSVAPDYEHTDNRHSRESGKPAQDAALAVDADDFELLRTLSVNIRPIMESAARLLTDAEIDAWFEGFAKANEGRGFYLELTAEGELVISPMVNRDGSFAEMALGIDLGVWTRGYGGEAHGANAIVRLPDGSRVFPDASWLSPEQVAELPPVSAGGAITVCPAFVAEIRSHSDNLPPLVRKMERYVANGARLAWLIDPYRRQVHIYRPGAEPELLDDPETIAGETVLPAFLFQVRQRIFDLHQSTTHGTT